jgi:predicted RNase H-like nuclease (RuvC/YqgF family)
LKDVIQEKEVKGKAEKDKRNGIEQEMLDITSYKEEIKRLRDQVAMLKKKTREVLEKEIIEEKNKSEDLSEKFEKFSEKQEE